MEQMPELKVALATLAYELRRIADLLEHPGVSVSSLQIIENVLPKCKTNLTTIIDVQTMYQLSQ